MLPSTGYGRRIRTNRFARRVRTRTRPQTRRRRRPNNNATDPDIITDSQEIREMRVEFATGAIPRVPRSTFCVASSPGTLESYRKIAKTIASLQRSEKRWRDKRVKSRRDTAMKDVAKAKEMSNNADYLMHNSPHSDVAMTRLFDATRLLKKATIILAQMANLENDHDIVFVYDVDEISMISRSYVAEFMTLFPEINSYSLSTLPDKILNTVLFTDFDYMDEDLISMNHVNEDSDHWRHFGPRYRALEVLYNEISIGYRDGDPDISQELCNRAGLAQQTSQLRKTVAELQKRAHQRWRLVRKCLELVEQKSRSTPGKYANVIISSEGVADGAAKLMISGHSSYVPINNIYSIKTRGEDAIFKVLVKMFGDTCVFVHVSSLPLPQNPDRRRQICHWPVEAADSFKKLYKAQKRLLFGSQNL